MLDGSVSLSTLEKHRTRLLRSEMLWLSGERDTARALLGPLVEKLRGLAGEDEQGGGDEARR